VLTRENWEGGVLKEILSRAVKPNQGRKGDRFLVAGSDVRIRPTLALSLSMVQHELCTNASKYGALSNEHGRGGIFSSVVRELERPLLALTLEETGVPPVEPPRHEGFGSRLIQRSLVHEFGGSVDLAFDRDSVVCAIRVPVEEDEMSPPWILVAEDEPLISMLLEDLLQALGFDRVHVVSRLDEGLAAAQAEAFDLAFLDPNLNGQPTYPIADQLAARGIPFTMVTGFGIAGLDEGRKRLEVSQKPFTVDDLSSVLDRLLGPNWVSQQR
jgi:CheY-like chemotaxis protein